LSGEHQQQPHDVHYAAVHGVQKEEKGQQLKQIK
jgi:hypothetical protein